MLGLADASDSALAVVGWVNFEDAGDRRQLERLARHPKLAGVRPLIQDIPDVDWMLRGDVQWAYQAIIDVDLTFDALGFPPHLDNFLTIFRRYPDLRVVIDHCMKPRIRDYRTEPAAAFDDWAEKMSRLADETAAFCKLSGLVTEANEDWTVDDLRPFAGHVLSAFGPERVMWGSDWPVCRNRATYDALVGGVAGPLPLTSTRRPGPPSSGEPRPGSTASTPGAGAAIAERQSRHTRAAASRNSAAQAPSSR